MAIVVPLVVLLALAALAVYYFRSQRRNRLSKLFTKGLRRECNSIVLYSVFVMKIMYSVMRVKLSKLLTKGLRHCHWSLLLSLLWSALPCSSVLPCLAFFFSLRDTLSSFVPELKSATNS